MSIDEILQSPADRRSATAAPRRALLGRARLQPLVAGWPQVSLLPREIADEAHQRSIRRSLVAAVGGVAVLVIAASALAASTAATAHQQLDAATARTASLQAQVRKFDDVTRLRHQLALAQSAVRVGSSTAIDWEQRIDEIEALKPADFTVTSAVTDSATPIAAYAQGTSPLEKPRAATITMTATAPTIAELPIWLRKLPTLRGFADAAPTVTGGDDADYTVVLTIHLDEQAYVTPLKKESAR